MNASQLKRTGRLALLGAMSLTLSACGGGSGGSGGHSHHPLLGVWDFTDSSGDVYYYVFAPGNAFYEVDYLGDIVDDSFSCYDVFSGSYVTDGRLLSLGLDGWGDRSLSWSITQFGELRLVQGDEVVVLPRPRNGIASLADMRPRCGA